MINRNSQQSTSKSTSNATASTGSLPNATGQKQIRVQNYLVIWVDGSIALNNKDCQNTLTQLREVVRKVNFCTTPEECIQFLNQMDDERAFIISSGALGQQLVSDIHHMAQVDAIYIFCGNKTRHAGWTKYWPKIEGVFISITPICESLKKVARECDHETIPMSFVSKRMVAPGEQNINELPSSYMYTMLFKEIALEIDEDDGNSVNNLIAFCRNKGAPESELRQFQHGYQQKSPIWCYSQEIFLYGMLNCALRSLDMETMAKMGFFIRKLHQQLRQLHEKQARSFMKQFIVYRGQGLPQDDFENLVDTKGGVLSFNNFLSTSKHQHVAMGFVERTLNKYENHVGILFTMTINPSKISISKTPFALIDEHSAAPQEEEILFSMHAVFRIDVIKQTEQNSRVWEVHLTLTDDHDPQLAALTDRMKKEIDGSRWHRMAKLMYKLGHFNQAEELYKELLKNASGDSDSALIYHQLGYLKGEQGEYKDAVGFYEKALKIYQKTLPENHSLLASTYNNIGLAYDMMGDYAKALDLYEKAHQIKEKTLPPNHPDLAISYHNIGGMYKHMGAYAKALEYYEKTLEIDKSTLPVNHPDSATSYNNIGRVYDNMGNYSKALEFYEKAHKIREKTLPPNHPDLAYSCNNIGMVYDNMGDYSKAFAFLEKALTIGRKSLSPTHPLIKAVIDNIADLEKKL
ncbi:unnamed protein product [Rotaria magnacalcarata]|uniref:Kinesin light chain n=1 Tax=Rotaria magnacalcarata TaxID=392030 RepID=A0A816Q885_9BILA|nr:unnamed protein product [Rotaria magnacalcarata]